MSEDREIIDKAFYVKLFNLLKCDTRDRPKTAIEASLLYGSKMADAVSAEVMANGSIEKHGEEE